MPSSLRVRPLADHQSLRERIVERLRDAILAGDMPAQTRLREPYQATRNNPYGAHLWACLRHQRWPRWDRRLIGPWGCSR
jgi:hypothetical protein